MHRILSIALAATVMAGPSLAETTCSSAPASKFQSQDALKAQLASQGMEVRQIKTEGGCYEVYAIELGWKDGERGLQRRDAGAGRECRSR